MKPSLDILSSRAFISSLLFAGLRPGAAAAFAGLRPGALLLGSILAQEDNESEEVFPSFALGLHTFHC